MAVEPEDPNIQELQQKLQQLLSAVESRWHSLQVDSPQKAGFLRGPVRLGRQALRRLDSEEALIEALERLVAQCTGLRQLSVLPEYAEALQFLKRQEVPHENVDQLVSNLIEGVDVADFVQGHVTSNCCGAPALGEIIDGEGVCAQCKEHAEFFEEEEEELPAPDLYFLIDDKSVIKIAMDHEVHRWVETLETGPDPGRIGGAKYMSYLKPEDILHWLNRDYNNVKQITVDEAHEFAENYQPEDWDAANTPDPDEERDPELASMMQSAREARAHKDEMVKRYPDWNESSVEQTINSLLEGEPVVDIESAPPAPFSAQLPTFAPQVEEVIKNLFPNSHVKVKYSQNLMDCIDVWFTIEPSSEWPNGIFHNAQYLIMHIDEKNRRREVGTGPYEVECTSAHIGKYVAIPTPPGRKFQHGPKFIKKTGTLEQILGHIRKYFNNLARSISASTPVEESLLEDFPKGGSADIWDHAADLCNADAFDEEGTQFFDFLAQVLNGGVEQWLHNCPDQYDGVVGTVMQYGRGNPMTEWVNPRLIAKFKPRSKATWEPFEAWLYSDDGKRAYNEILEKMIAATEPPTGPNADDGRSDQHLSDFVAEAVPAFGRSQWLNQKQLEFTRAGKRQGLRSRRLTDFVAEQMAALDMSQAPGGGDWGKKHSFASADQVADSLLNGG